jgi:hypothetical protein
VEEKMPAYKWPGKTGYSFGLTEYTDEGRPSLRMYVNVSLNTGNRGTLDIIFQPRAVRAAGDELSSLTDAFPDQCSKNTDDTLTVNFPEDKRAQVKEAMEGVLEQMVRGWKEKTSGQSYPSNQDEAQPDSGAASAGA